MERTGFCDVGDARFKLWWCGNRYGCGGVGAMMKEQLYQKVVEVRIMSHRVMVVVLVFYDNVLRLICEYAQQSVRSFEDKIFL